MPTIAIIEDDASIARLLKRHLDSAGHTTHVEAAGEAALRWLASNDVDAVVCDLGLPTMSGAAVIEALRAEQRTMHLPIVVVSARITVADHTLALSAGADAFFEKPIKLKALDDELRRLLAARTSR